MPRFVRGAAHYVAPPFYLKSVPGQPFGHSPIEIELTKFAGAWTSGNAESASCEFELWVDGANHGTILYVPSGGHGIATVDPPVVIPAVTSANVDGASRFGMRVTSNTDTEVAVLSYRTTQVADAGKTVFGVGSDVLCGGDGGGDDGLFGAPQNCSGGSPGGWTSGGSSWVFNTMWELTDSPLVGPNFLVGANAGVAAVPWAVSATWDDFMVVLRTNPDGTYRFHLRIDGATVKTLEVTAGSTRVWSFAGTVDIQAGQHVCWQYEGVSGTAGLGGEILWTGRAFSTGLALGAGESAGEF